MKANLFQLVTSSVVLGLMTGAVGYHWHQLGQFEPSALPDEPKEGYVLISSGGSGSLGFPWTESDAFEDPPQSPSVSRGESDEMNATVAALSEIVSVLKELKEENRDLRDQIEESNRDQSEMRFQIEMHSKEFRPLNLGPEPARRVEKRQSHPLLPPKKR
jgi:hypothetical protein